MQINAPAVADATVLVPASADRAPEVAANVPVDDPLGDILGITSPSELTKAVGLYGWTRTAEPGLWRVATPWYAHNVDRAWTTLVSPCAPSMRPFVHVADRHDCTCDREEYGCAACGDSEGYPPQLIGMSGRPVPKGTIYIVGDPVDALILELCGERAVSYTPKAVSVLADLIQADIRALRESGAVRFVLIPHPTPGALTATRRLAEALRKARVGDVVLLDTCADPEWLSVAAAYVAGQRKAGRLRSRIGKLPIVLPSPAGAPRAQATSPKQAAAAAVPDGLRRSDVGQAQRFVAAHGGEVRYYADAKAWLVWNGTLWVRDTDNSAAVTQMMTADALELESLDRQYARRAQSAKTMAAALSLAATMDLPTGGRVTVTSEELDQHPHLLPVANGTIDLRTGEFTPPNRTLLCTKGSPAVYDKDATCPKILAFMHAITQGDAQLIRWLQVYLGLCLTGESAAQVAVWLYGDGGNGKGVLIRLMEHVLGRLSMATPMKTFLEQRHEDKAAATPEIAGMAGSRLVTASEGKDGVALDTALIKWLTGGDRLVGRYQYGRPFEFSPTHKVIISTNHEPIIRTLDGGIDRRLLVVPLKVLFVRNPHKPHLPVAAPTFDREEELYAELPGFLNWLLEGSIAWYAAGANTAALGKAAPCAAIDEETARYIESQDTIQAFLGERTMVAPQGQVQAGELYRAYVRWCDESAITPVSMTRFGRTLSDKAFSVVHRNGSWRHGLVLKR